MEAKYISLKDFLCFLFFLRAKGCCLPHAVWGMCQTLLKCLKATGVHSPPSFLIPTATDTRSQKGVSETT